MDTEAEPALAARFGIRSVPTVVIFRGGREIARQAGAVDRRTLTAWVPPCCRKKFLAPGFRLGRRRPLIAISLIARETAMKIAAANLQMSSAYQAETRHETQERLHVCGSVPRPPGRAGDLPPPAKSPARRIFRMPARRLRQPIRARSRMANPPTPPTAAHHPGGNATGRPVRILEADGLCRCDEPAAVAPLPTPAPPPPTPRPAGAWNTTTMNPYSETEQLSFAANGTVRTADGRNQFPAFPRPAA